MFGRIIGPAAALVLLSCIGLATADAASTEAEFGKVFDDLGVTLPADIVRRPQVLQRLETLRREPCDQTAVVELATALEGVTYRRQAAEALVGFSASCNGFPDGLRRAINILLKLNDHTRAEAISSALISIEPDRDNGYFLRALARDGLGHYDKAIGDYISAIELFGAKDKIASVSYMNMSRDYEKLKRPCDAIRPVEAWIALNPARNGTTQTTAIINRLALAENCDADAPRVEERIDLATRGNVSVVQGSINGVKGNFIVDTGASFVSISQSFAAKAGIRLDTAQEVQMHTANGRVDALLTRAGTVALRKIEAKDVEVVVQSDKSATYGPKIDGLLGMSFLSRFDVRMDSSSLRIRARQRFSL